jgi:hypothetical protein
MSYMKSNLAQKDLAKILAEVPRFAAVFVVTQPYNRRVQPTGRVI